ncbi:hypothetical protein B0H17DRAFT_1193860 [Mycena rosella]|uniref:DUF6589 domain-containing protein n=1 Tax=Mycena rosella TaxID=1033263 RepID=A0AAD7M6Q6_MYCRO|nr:hypothetical protein B0H17DRAFT_1193860 [Mycena rosella]
MLARAWLPGRRALSAITYTIKSASWHAKIAQIPEAATIYEQRAMAELAALYKNEDPFLWYLTECFSASRKKGQVIAHIDVKRVFCRFGYAVSDSTTRNALTSLTNRSLNKLKAKVQDATAWGETEFGKISDNVQRYAQVFEHGLGKENELKHGTVCTAVGLDDCKPGAFRASDHIARVLKQDRQTMMVESLYDSIDWEHMDNITNLHFVRVVVDFSPWLNPLASQVLARFRTALAKHRLEPRKKRLQPLSTNSEQQMENKGYQAGFHDFDEQMGIEPEKCNDLLSWNRADGGGHATLMRQKMIQVPTKDIYASYRNAISTPETWHTKSTQLNSAASNHYGPAASPDPSSLSRSSNAANMKRPTDLKKCDFYPTSRSISMIWDAHVLDCWRLVLGCDSDLLTHFEELAAHDCLPSIDDLLEQASILRERYASQAAYEQALDKAEQDGALHRSKFPMGSAWTPPSGPEAPVAENDIDTEMPGLNTIPDVHNPAEDAAVGAEPSAEIPTTPEPKDSNAEACDAEEGPKVHKEPPGFNGDRVLSNSILFLMEFGWWIELNYAIPEGDVGRVFEIWKIFIFTFAGSSNQNYMKYMLDLYALLEFECSPELKEALLNNWLMTLCGEIGTFVEGDIMQEWNNRWLTQISGQRGGDFDEKFYRKTIAPNVLHFLQIKEDIESAFDLKHRRLAVLFSLFMPLPNCAKLQQPVNDSVISDERLFSGSDLTVTVDPDTGRLSDDWYEPEEFEALVERLCGPELQEEESEDEEPESDEPETESEGEDSEDD